MLSKARKLLAPALLILFVSLGRQSAAETVLPRTTGTAGQLGPNQEEIKLKRQRLKANCAGTMIINVTLPEGYHLNSEAAQRYKISLVRGASIKLDPKTAARTSRGLKLPLEVSFDTLAKGPAELKVQLTLFYCREDNNGTCHIKTLVFHVPIEVTDEEGAPSEIRVEGRIEVK